MPRDPINILANHSFASSGGGWHRYYCYVSGSAYGMPNSDSAVLTYRGETKGDITDKFAVDSCLDLIPQNPINRLPM